MLSKGVLWHEYNHTEPWILNGTTEGHGDNWVRRMMRKPWLAFLSVVARLVIIA